MPLYMLGMDYMSTRDIVLRLLKTVGTFDSLRLQLVTKTARIFVALL